MSPHSLKTPVTLFRLNIKRDNKYVFFLAGIMEILMIQSRQHLPQSAKRNKTTNGTLSQKKAGSTMYNTTLVDENVTKFDSLNNSYNYFTENNTYWNSTELFNITNSSDFSIDYDYQMFNSSVSPTREPWAGFCKEWTPAQHNLYQTANFFFAAAFLVPGSFKQSVLLVRYKLESFHKEQLPNDHVSELS